jgi:hypothetical protein
MSEKTEGAIKNEQYRDTGNIWVHKTQDEDNTETLATFGTQDTGRRQYRDTGNIWVHKTKTIQRHWQHLGTQDTGRRQYRDTGNIWYTRYMTKTIQRHWQHLVHKTQDEDNTETRATVGTQDEDNPETLATFGTQDT